MIEVGHPYEVNEQAPASGNNTAGFLRGAVISGGAFPSLHVGLSAVALIYAYKYRNVNRAFRIIWYAYVPLVLSLWFSTIYLRHHWVIDIFAGWAVAAAGYVGAAGLMRIWARLRERYGLPF